MTVIKLLGIAGSLRRASTNRGLLRAAQANLPADAAMEIADLTDIPFYNQDIATEPAAIERVLAQIGAADALVLGSTEYNYSMAPALKNILDWASREPNDALLAGKPVAIMGAAGGFAAEGNLTDAKLTQQVAGCSATGCWPGCASSPSTPRPASARRKRASCAGGCRRWSSPSSFPASRPWRRRLPAPCA